MIALFAIITNVLSPEALTQVQSTADSASRMEICHAMMAMPMASDMDAMGPADADSAPRDGATKGHACCKVCVCHPAATALPTAFYVPTLLLPSHQTLPSPGKVGLPPGKFSTKSSPRGPPSLV
ncbi:DUF2946 domain-containing protein [Duganella sp. FT135W]|uniref:DUF2946 domain-containing protein n=2 Tax=Duganella flavida TaxID=2692175 RepID=A0A6L8K7U0_9BURK|nr:DUF2946 domain-containing protein [Duganella flavida]